MTKCGQSGIKIVYNHNNEDYIITGIQKINGMIILIWNSVVRWPMYQIKSTDISMIIIIEMYRRRKNYILRTVLIVLILTFNALKVDLCFVKKIKTVKIVILSLIKEK